MRRRDTDTVLTPPKRSRRLAGLPIVTEGDGSDGRSLSPLLSKDRRTSSPSSSVVTPVCRTPRKRGMRTLESYTPPKLEKRLYRGGYVGAERVPSINLPF